MKLAVVAVAIAIMAAAVITITPQYAITIISQPGIIVIIKQHIPPHMAIIGTRHHRMQSITDTIDIRPPITPDIMATIITRLLIIPHITTITATIIVIGIIGIGTRPRTTMPEISIEVTHD